MKEMRYTSKSNAGFTLIEMMIAVTVGLFILGAVSAVAINSARSSRANDRTSELQTNGRYALDVLRRDVQHAGQSGLTPPQTLSNGFFQVAPGVNVTNDCWAGFSFQLNQPVWGLNNTNNDATGNVSACIPNANYSAATDVLAIRYADMNALTVPVAAPTTAPTAAPVSAVNNDIYFRSAYDASRLFQIGIANPTAIGNGPMQDQLLKSYVYYIGPNTAANDGIPALYRLSLRAGAMTPELVSSGIENLQVRYGVLDSAGNTQFLDANNVTVANWPLVNSVRVWLLARNSGSERNETYSNTTSYPMGDVNFTPTVGTNDQFRRQLYTATIQLRN
jgi:type IV pilus assembly protein PilW